MSENNVAKPVNIAPTKVAGGNILGSGLGAAAIKAYQDSKAAGTTPVPTKPEPTTITQPITPVKVDAVKEQPKEEEKVSLVEDKPAEAKTEEKITDDVFAKRMSKIANAQKALDKQKQEFSKERAELEHLRKLTQFTKDQAAKDPIKAVKEHFGVEPEVFIDAWLKTQGATPKQRQQVQEQGITKDQLTAILKEEVDKSLKTYKEESTNEAVLAWKENTLKPLLADTAKFPLLNEEYGDNVADVLHKAMFDRAQKANAYPDSDPNKQQYIRESHDPYFMSDLAEKTLRKQAERYAKILGVETTPKTEATTNANAATPMANGQKKEIQFNHIWRPSGKMSYTTKPKE